MPMKKIIILISIDAVNKHYLDNITNSTGEYPIRQQSPDRATVAQMADSSFILSPNRATVVISGYNF